MHNLVLCCIVIHNFDWAIIVNVWFNDKLFRCQRIIYLNNSQHFYCHFHRCLLSAFQRSASIAFGNRFIELFNWNEVLLFIISAFFIANILNRKNLNSADDCNHSLDKYLMFINYYCSLSQMLKSEFIIEFHLYFWIESMLFDFMMTFSALLWHYFTSSTVFDWFNSRSINIYYYYKRRKKMRNHCQWSHAFSGST